MKKALSFLTAIFLVLTTIFVPVGFNVFANEGYLTKFDFSFMKDDIYNYNPLTYSKEAEGTLTFAPVSGGAAVSFAPIYSPTNYINKWGGPTAEYTSVKVDGADTDALKLKANNDAFFVPIMENGKPFELEPGHTYTVNIAYTKTGNATTDSWYAQRGFYIGGGIYAANADCLKIARNFAKVDAFGGAKASLPFGAKADDLSNIDSDGLIEKTVYFTTPAAQGEGYTYNAQRNSYTADAEVISASGTGTVGEKISTEFFNYLYLYIDHYGSSEINIVSLSITRDDYIQKGVVEYIDADGKVLKTAESNNGEHSVCFIPENREDVYFAGWYYDADYQNKVTTAVVSVPAEGVKLYAKWDEYKTSITSTDISKFYGTCSVPSLNAAGVYSHVMSNRSNVNLTSLVTNKGYLGLTTTFWGDGILLTAVDDTTAELFRAKPNTTYKISLKFRITSETVRADGVDVNIAAGAGLPNSNANYPMGKYFDENSLKSRSSFTSYTDGVTPQGEYFEYSAVYTTGEFTTIPAIGVELWLYEGASVEVYSLSVSEFDGESLSDGEFLVTKEAENNTTYLINFDYALSAVPALDIGIGFKTTAADTIGYPTFIEGKNKAIFTVNANKTVGQWYTASVLLTTDMMASVVNSYGFNDVITSLNTNLYGYIIGDEAAKLSVKNIAVTALSDKAGNDLINANGGQCLNEEAEGIENSQAIRYSFTYDTKTGAEIFIGDNEYKVIERGFIYVNGNNYAKGGIYKGDFNLSNAKSGAFKFSSRTNNLDLCWKFAAIENTDLYSLAFSTYVKDFDIDDTKEMMVKAYLVIEIDGQQFTVYSDSVNRSVAYLKSIG